MKYLNYFNYYLLYTKFEPNGKERPQKGIISLYSDPTVYKLKYDGSENIKVEDGTREKIR